MNAPQQLDQSYYTMIAEHQKISAKRNKWWNLSFKKNPYFGITCVILKMSYRDWETDRKSTRLNSSHSAKSRMPSSA